MLGTVGNGNLVGRVAEAVIALVGVANGLLQLRNAGGRRVMGVAGIHRGFGRFANVRRRDEVGLAERKVIDGDAGVFELACLGRSGNRRGGTNLLDCCREFHESSSLECLRTKPGRISRPSRHQSSGESSPGDRLDQPS